MSVSSSLVMVVIALSVFNNDALLAFACLGLVIRIGKVKCTLNTMPVGWMFVYLFCQEAGVFAFLYQASKFAAAGCFATHRCWSTSACSCQSCTRWTKSCCGSRGTLTYLWSMLRRTSTGCQGRFTSRYSAAVPRCSDELKLITLHVFGARGE